MSDATTVVVLGGANIDIVGRPGGRLLPGDSTPGSVAISAGGVARNIAETIARLGGPVSLVAAIGNDAWGEVIDYACTAAGVDTAQLFVVDATTDSYLVLLDADGSLHAAVNDMRLVAGLDPTRLAARADRVDSATLLVVDANLPAESLRWIAGRTAGRPLLADAVSASKAPRLMPVLDGIDTLKLTTDEAGALAGDAAGHDAGDPANWQTTAGWFLERGVNRVVMTGGTRGLWYADGNDCGHLPAIPRLRTPTGIGNSSGAGDALLAGLAWSRLQGWSFDRSLRFAMACADVTLDAIGAVGSQLSLAAVEARLGA